MIKLHVVKKASLMTSNTKTRPLASQTTPHCMFFPKCLLARNAPWHVYYGMMWCAVVGWCVACNSVILGFKWDLQNFDPLFLFQLPGNWQQLLTIQEMPSMTLAQPLKDRWVISACTVETMHCTSRTFQNPHGQWSVSYTHLTLPTSSEV